MELSSSCTSCKTTLEAWLVGDELTEEVTRTGRLSHTQGESESARGGDSKHGGHTTFHMQVQTISSECGGEEGSEVKT